MRWIFVALILINGCYLGWELWQRSLAPMPQSQQPVQAPEKTVDESLVLLTERLPSPESTEPPPSLPANNASPTLDAPRAARQVCSSVGPFVARSNAEEILSVLTGSGVDGQIREVLAKSGSRHWVVIPPLESRERALQLLRELQARKIDSFIVSSGDMKNAISLGVFAREELAADFREKLKAIGYPAQTRLKDPAKAEFWIYIAPGQLVESAKKVVEAHLSQDATAKISNTACETFAQSR